MKKILTTTLLYFLLLFPFISFSQGAPKDAIMIDANTIILDDKGEKVAIPKFAEMMNSGDWFVDPVKDKSGKITHMQLRKSTVDEKELMDKFLDTNKSSTTTIGEKVPEFSMTDIDGNGISSKDLLGKVVVLNFWFATCKPCIEEIPALNEVYKKYKDHPEVVFASITFEEKNKVISFLKKHPLDYPVISDARDICRKFSVNSYPTNIVIDKEGNYFDLISGGFPNIGEHISNKIDGATTSSKAQNK